MAPLLLLFLLGGLCALISLTVTSSRGSSARRREDAKGDGEEPRRRVDGSAPAEEAQRARARADPERDLGAVFSTFDHDGDGFVTAAELEESLRRLGIAVAAGEAAAMVARVDANRDRLIDIHEFRELYDSIPRKRKQHPAAAGEKVPVPVPVEGDAEEADGAEEERDLREAFDVFDGNKDGLISAEELGTVLRSLGLRRQGGSGPAAAADCRDMIRLVDRDGDGMVSFEEFKRMMAVVEA